MARPGPKKLRSCCCPGSDVLGATCTNTLPSASLEQSEPKKQGRQRRQPDLRGLCRARELQLARDVRPWQVAATTALAKAGRVRPKGQGQPKTLQVHKGVKGTPSQPTSNRAVNLQLAILRRTFSSWTASSMQKARAAGRLLTERGRHASQNDRHGSALENSSTLSEAGRRLAQRHARTQPTGVREVGNQRRAYWGWGDIRS